MTSITDHADPHECEPESFSDTIIAIDGNIQLYQFLTAMRNDGDLIRNKSGEPISHLLGMFNRTTSLLEHGIKPVYVFDGGYPDLKTEEVAERGERKQNAREKYEAAKEAGDTEAMEKYGPRAATITSQIQSETEKLLDFLGVPYLNAPSEADPQVAVMVDDGPAEYGATEDFDTLVHGAPAIIRHIGADGGSIVSLNQVLDDADLTYDELVWAAIASGTDYNDSPWRVGWVRASRMAKQAETFDDLVQMAYQRDVDKDRDPIDRERWYAVKDWFDDPTVTHDYDLDFQPPDRGIVHQYLVEQKGLRKRQVESGLEGI